MVEVMVKHGEEQYEERWFISENRWIIK